MRERHITPILPCTPLPPPPPYPPSYPPSTRPFSLLLQVPAGHTFEGGHGHYTTAERDIPQARRQHPLIHCKARGACCRPQCIEDRHSPRMDGCAGAAAAAAAAPALVLHVWWPTMRVCGGGQCGLGDRWRGRRGRASRRQGRQGRQGESRQGESEIGSGGRAPGKCVRKNRSALAAFACRQEIGSQVRLGFLFLLLFLLLLFLLIFFVLFFVLVLLVLLLLLIIIIILLVLFK